MAHICQQVSSGLKYFLSADEEAQKRPGGETVRDECRTPSFDHPDFNKRSQHLHFGPHMFPQLLGHVS